jgi:hypothetical protein
VLEHTGEALVLLVGFWRFVCCDPYRRRKVTEWRESADSLGGRLAVGSEIVTGVVMGLGLPLALILGFWALVFGM